MFGSGGEVALPKRVALMQPYFFPYPRYFRLIAEVDEFIIHDDVQFPKAGRVNRTEVPGPGGEPEWLTLPLARQPFDTLICNRLFADDARSRFSKNLARYSWINGSFGPAAAEIREYLYAPLDGLLDYLESGLRLVARLLGINTKMIRSSSLDLGSLRRQDRVIGAVHAVGGTQYVNLPGGVSLYDPAEFEANGIELRFLRPYDGGHRRILPALMAMRPTDIEL